MTNQQDLNVFLVPVDWPNFGETVETEPIELSQYAERPSPLVNRDEVRLWGARVGDRNRSAFEKMSTGDLLLFYNDRRYVGKGRVGKTFEDPEGWVTETFWNGAPSRLIYTVERYRTIDVPLNTVNRLFDYSTDYYPQGLMRVAERRVTANFGTIWRAFKRFGQSDE